MKKGKVILSGFHINGDKEFHAFCKMLTKIGKLVSEENMYTHDSQFCGGSIRYCNFDFKKLRKKYKTITVFLDWLEGECIAKMPDELEEKKNKK